MSTNQVANKLTNQKLQPTKQLINKPINQILGVIHIVNINILIMMMITIQIIKTDRCYVCVTYGVIRSHLSPHADHLHTPTQHIAPILNTFRPTKTNIFQTHLCSVIMPLNQKSSFQNLFFAFLAKVYILIKCIFGV